MKMNSLERLLVNNPVRTWMLRQLALDLLARHAVSLSGKRVLEIGCGQGSGTELLLRDCGADKVFAFDYDPRQLNRAKQRHRAHGIGGTCLFVGDGERLPFANEQFDVIVEFAILHHMPGWRLAVSEIARVLRPGGILVYEEYLERFVANPVVLRLLDHPREGWFKAEAFYDALTGAGLRPMPPQRHLGNYWLAGTAERIN
ncbi:MAG: class I SAM-dependent methyltransferase [Candidatus Hydrogenedentes bacterium]|nr:class I SAM-dependent methyltransferase [Candidatus Hydrogenedentota bacterium]